MKFSLRCILWIFLAVTCFAFATFAENPRITFHSPATLKVGRERFDLASSNGLVQFVAFAKRATISTNQFSKKDRRGFSEMLRLIESNPSLPTAGVIHHQLLELATAIANNHRPQIPPYVGLPDLPFRFIDSLSNPVGKGRTPATNLDATPPSCDLSLLDPQPSTFWQRPACIPAQNLYTGFGRTVLPTFHDPVWNYSGPKKNGGNPGCELITGSRRIKVKFAETHAEPFAARIFHALGYHVEQTDFAPRLKIRYDRRFFLEFNSRPEITMKIGFFFIPIHTFHFEDNYDPFDVIERVVMKDAAIHDGLVLKKLLLRDPTRKAAAMDAENFRPEIESQIDYLITVEANIQPELDHVKTIGPWDFASLGHENLRGLRGAGVLAAWLGWWDSRFENTRLRVVQTESGPELRHYFSDLGATLGRSDGTYHHSCEDPDGFAEIFTRSHYSRGEKRWQIEFPNFEPIEDTLAFERMTFDDACWMARLIGQLSAAQITDALHAASFAPEQVQIYAAKLISRRNQLIRDTQLQSEFPMLELIPELTRARSKRVTVPE